MSQDNRASFAPIDRRDWLIGALIFLGTLTLLLSTTQMGFTRDESFYFHAAYDYVQWFEGLWDNLRAGKVGLSFTREVVDRHWSYNPEHPVLMKSLFALSYKLFYQKLQWLSLSDAMRLPTMVLSSWLVAMTYGFGRQLFGRAAGLIGALALLLQPRFFFHAHLACFDAPIAAMSFAVIYAYWRALGEQGARRWVWLTGALWGLALATKLNAFFLPVLLVIHWLLTRWMEVGIVRDAQTKRLSVRLPSMPWALVSMALLGPLIFYMHWPRIWFETVKRVWWYMKFHLHHEHYLVDYFGQWLQHPPFPWSYPWVMTLVTVPAVTLVASGLGLVFWWHQRDVLARVKQWTHALKARALPPVAADPRGTGLLLAINFLFPIMLIARPSTPIFGGTKHWMPSMPYLSMMAGFGVVFSAQLAWRWFARESSGATSEAGDGDALPQTPSSRGQQALTLLLGASLLLPAAWELRNNHPFGTSYYNAFIGSTQGAADRLMMRQFWGYGSRQALPWLNTHAKPSARVYTHNTTSWAFSDMQRDGLARKDLRITGLAGSDFTLYEHQRAFVYQLVQIWEEYGTRAPVYVVKVDGVPVVSVYARPGAVAPKDVHLQP